MTNAELKYLVEVYWQIRHELEKLQGNHIKNCVELKMFTELEYSLKEKYAPTKMLIDRKFHEIFYPEQSKCIADESEAFKAKNISEIKMRIEYLDTKLKVIENMLGADLVELEKYEKERILRQES